jgi:hypothetical protein
LKAGSFNDGNTNNNDSTNIDQKKAMIHIWTCYFDGDNTDSPCTPPYEEQLRDVNKAKGNSAMQMGSDIRNLKFVIENNNPDAVGIRFTGSQDNLLSNITVEAGDAFAGIYGSSGTNTTNQDITVEGGKYGIYGGFGEWAAYTNVRLINQTILAITSHSGPPFTLNGFEIIKNTAPAIGDVAGENYSSTNSYHQGTSVLSDGTITFTASNNQAAIDIPSGNQFGVTNVYVKNAAKLIQTEDRSVNGNSTGWSYINYFANTMPGGNGYKLIEGVEDKTDYVTSNSFQTSGVTVPNSTKIRMNHGFSPDTIPSPDVLLDLSKNPNSGVVNVADKGIPPLTNLTDNSPDYSTKLNELFSDPTINTVFLPKGTYPIKNTLVFGKDTKIIGLANILTSIEGHPQWKPGRRVDFIRTVNDKNATTLVAHLKVRFDTSKDNNYFDTFNWQAGKDSIVYNIMYRAKGAGTKCTDLNTGWGNPRNDWHFSGHGGGRMWGIGTGGVGCSKFSDKYRGVLVENTSQPLTFYGLNPEDGHGWFVSKQTGFMVELDNAKNVSIRSIKSEDSRTLLIKNSDNIFITGGGGTVDWVSQDNRNTLLLNLVPKKILWTNNKPRDLYKEVVNNNTVKMYKTTSALSAVSRGTIDYSVWDTDYVPPIQSPTPTGNPSDPTPSPTSTTKLPQFDNDQDTDWLDILLFIPRFTQQNRPKYDLNSNGFVDVFDFASSIINFNHE